jgi:hypothetical protein
MYGPTLCCDVECTTKDTVILDNLMLEQEDAMMARGLGSQATELVKDDCIITQWSSCATLQLSTVTPLVHARDSGMTSTPLHTPRTIRVPKGCNIMERRQKTQIQVNKKSFV